MSVLGSGVKTYRIVERLPIVHVIHGTPSNNLYRIMQNLTAGDRCSACLASHKTTDCSRSSWISRVLAHMPLKQLSRDHACASTNFTVSVGKHVRMYTLCHT